MMHSYRLAAAAGLFLLALTAHGVPAGAHVGLCCGKCGGNLPMNIPGGGVPESYGFRFKIRPMVVYRNKLPGGTRDVSPPALLGMPVVAGRPAGKYMAVPGAVDMTMVNRTMGYSFTGDLSDALQVVRPEIGLPAPGFELQRLDGGTAGIADFKGRLVLLNFWATWCKPCREEMPALQSLWRRYRARGLTVLAVAADRGNRDGIADFVSRLHADFPVLLDPDGKVRIRYEVTGLPFTYIIGRDGRFIGRVVGARDWDGPRVRELIKALLTDAAQRPARTPGI